MLEDLAVNTAEAQVRLPRRPPGAPRAAPSPSCRSPSWLWPRGAKPPRPVVPVLVPVLEVMRVHPKDQPRAFALAGCFWAIISLWEQFP